MIKNIIVLGAGSAGLLSAIALKRKIPQVNVRVVRSKAIGVIGVGESTTPNFPRHLFDYLRIPRKRFYELAQPTWKLGIKFLWGKRGRFDYTFEPVLDTHWPDMEKPTGYYCRDNFDNVGLPAALMRQDMAFPRQANGAPDIHAWHAFHIENVKFVEILEIIAREAGVEFTEGNMNGHDRGPEGIQAIHLEDGQRLEADFFIDASGFRSELLGKALEEPWESFGKSLFCDRAVLGGWERGKDEPILPYTTAETMDAGWAWRIDHESLINRGYVYCSGAISDDDAREEFHRKNPKVETEPKIVKFRSGCYRRQWVDNVVGMGNAAGFVEPLEATALMILCSNIETLVDFLRHSDLEPTPSWRDLFNKASYEQWIDIRDFLSIHYKYNGLLDTPFWKQARAEADVSGIEGLLKFYEENGPTGFCRHHMPEGTGNFGLEGFLVMLVGQQVPYKRKYQVPAREQEIWNGRLAAMVAQAAKGIRSEEALAYVKHPGWRWNSDPG